MTITKKFTLFAFIFLVLFLFIGVPVGVQVATNLRAITLDNLVADLEKQFSQDTEEMLETATRFSVDSTIVSSVRLKSVPDLDERIEDIRANENVDFVTVTDMNGIVLSRTIDNSIRGDYLYDSTSYGATLSEGKNISGVEKTLFHSLVAIGATPIYSDSDIIGSLIVGRVLNDSYAQAMSAQIPETHFIFYSQDRGIVGSSFISRETEEVVRTNFDTTIINTEEGVSPLSRVAIEGRVYDVRNISFPGTSGVMGGVLVLNEKNALKENVLIAVVLAVLYLAVLLLYVVFNSRGGSLISKPGQTGMIMTSSVILLILSSFYTAGGVLSKTVTRIEKPVYPIYNSTMHIEPANGVYSVYSEQVAKIVLETGGEAINAAQVIVHYDSNKIRMERIETENSFCDEALFIRRDIDPNAGTVTISCGKARPGFTETTGLVAELVFTPLVPGSFSLEFDDDSQILAHDGLGTNVLRISTGASYSAVEGDLFSVSATSTLVFSTTHPNGEQWYANRDIRFSWRNRDADGYFYSFDQNPTSTPVRSVPVATTSITTSATNDGIYYFHVQAIKNGERVGDTAHYKVKVDSTPPDRPIIKASKTELKPGETMRLEFVSNDAVSGLQNNYYYIKFNNGIFFPMRSPIYAAFPESGTYNITIRAFDNAGNTSDAEITITVEDSFRFLWRLFNLPASVIHFVSSYEAK
ncbi:MAG: hypothetical protein WDZ88_00690 [Candidatus Paceibacterota bacterium]